MTIPKLSAIIIEMDKVNDVHNINQKHFSSVWNCQLSQVLFLLYSETYISTYLYTLSSSWD